MNETEVLGMTAREKLIERILTKRYGFTPSAAAVAAVHDALTDEYLAEHFGYDPKQAER